MAQERAPKRVEAIAGAGTVPTPWPVVLERLQHPEPPQTSWLATVRPDGRPHLVPVLSFWVDGAFHVLAGEATRKARNLAADGHCVVAMTSTTLPSFDIVAEGEAELLDDPDEVRRIVDVLGANDWPLEVRGTDIYGPHAPTAGPPPYRIYRIVPSKVFGLPGMQGMDQFEPDELPKSTRFVFDR